MRDAVVAGRAAFAYSQVGHADVSAIVPSVAASIVHSRVGCRPRSSPYTMHTGICQTGAPTPAAAPRGR